MHFPGARRPRSLSLLALLVATTPPASAPAAPFALFSWLASAGLRLYRCGSSGGLLRGAFRLLLTLTLLLLRAVLAAGFLLASLLEPLLVSAAVALTLRLLSVRALPLPTRLLEAGRLAVTATALPLAALVPAAAGSAIRPGRRRLGRPLRCRSRRRLAPEQPQKLADD